MTYLISLRKHVSKRPVDRYFIYFGQWFQVHKAGKFVLVLRECTKEEKEAGIRIGNQHFDENFLTYPDTGEVMYTGLGDFLDSLREH